MRTQSLGRTVVLLVLGLALLALTVVLVPAPVQVLAALLTLPLGAFFFSSATSSS